MRQIFILLIAVLPTVALAGQVGRQNPDKAPAFDKLPPPKAAKRGNACAAFGPGFVQVEGTDTCMRIGGAVSIGGGVSSGGR